eukprot:gnl/TRDRNA2_/TRDRNA2_189959_c0_seq1.p1 gnl/TRDRNA2_/TRDRNA2_189959_c0~~gnl/TRDRNA2_/TRDRNA2_189959_c0_seq1.p1  ORF type:complete len:343 (-),score=66.57 gnl/TRDRNA2_/TRDRNA2_189959_c0_seq1:149-1177(-)
MLALRLDSALLLWSISFGLAQEFINCDDTGADDDQSLLRMHLSVKPQIKEWEDGQSLLRVHAGSALEARQQASSMRANDTVLMKATSKNSEAAGEIRVEESDNIIVRDEANREPPELNTNAQKTADSLEALPTTPGDSLESGMDIASDPARHRPRVAEAPNEGSNSDTEKLHTVGLDMGLSAEEMDLVLKVFKDLGYSTTGELEADEAELGIQAFLASLPADTSVRQRAAMHRFMYLLVLHKGKLQHALEESGATKDKEQESPEKKLPRGDSSWYYPLLAFMIIALLCMAIGLKCTERNVVSEVHRLEKKINAIGDMMHRNENMKHQCDGSSAHGIQNPYGS